MSAKMGRPPKDNPINIRISVRLDAETDEKLTGYCERHDMTKGEAIRKGVIQMLQNERYEARVIHVKLEEAPKQEPQRLTLQVETKTSDEALKRISGSTPKLNVRASWKADEHK